MPRVLIIDEITHASPGRPQDFRLSQFIRFLPDAGWEPVCLSHRRFARAGKAAARRLQKRPNAGLGEPQRNGTANAAALPPLQWIWRFPGIYWDASRLAQTGDFDLIFSFGHALETHWLAGHLAGKFGLPWIPDLSRLTVPADGQPSIWRRNLLQSVEGMLTQSAAMAVISSEDRRDIWLDRLPQMPRAKIRYLPEGFDPFFDQRTSSENGRASTFRILFSQPVLHLRALRGFLLALESIFKKHPAWMRDFLLLWQGPIHDEIKGFLARVAGEKQFIWLKDQENGASEKPPRPEVILTFLPEQPTADFQVHASFFRLLPENRPYLAIGPDCSLRRFIRREKLGREFDPEEISGIAAALTYWFVEFKNGTLQSWQKDVREFGYDHLTRQLARHFDACLPYKLPS